MVLLEPSQGQPAIIQFNRHVAEVLLKSTNGLEARGSESRPVGLLVAPKVPVFVAVFAQDIRNSVANVSRTRGRGQKHCEVRFIAYPGIINSNRRKD